MLLCCYLGALSPIFAQTLYTISGTITDTEGQPLSYASISLDETKFGAVTDEEGKYRLRLPAGTHEVTVAYIGYSAQQDRITVKGDMVKNYQLAEEQVFLDDVIITPGEEDPAYAIIRLAIKNKKKNARPFPAYTYRAYTKTEIKFPDDFDPNTIGDFGVVVSNDGEAMDTTTVSEDNPEMDSKILFLNESLSKISVQEPNKRKEEILRSRISGDSKQFAPIGNNINRYDPYEDRTVMKGIADRGIISPISNGAFFSYKYKLLGTIRENGVDAYKIQVIPKRKHDPVFTGFIYIVDSLYAVKELDVYITKTQSIDLMDTLKIKQVYMEVADKWVYFQSRMGFSFSFNLFGFTIPFDGFSMSLLSEYNTAAQFEKRHFGKEVLAIDDSALAHTPAFWDSLRPIPLTIAEASDYQLKDSLEAVRNSPEYLDSLSRRSRKVNFRNLLLSGHTFYNYRKKTSLTIRPLISGIGFNPIEGWNIELSAVRRMRFGKGNRLAIEPQFRYGFSNNQLSYKVAADIGLKKRRGRIKFEVGDYITEFSPFPQISRNLNTGYSLFGKVNYKRFYQKKFISLFYRKEILNGLRFAGKIAAFNRRSLANTSDYSIWNKTETYAPNFSLPEHRGLVGDVRLIYQPFNRYIRTPNGRTSLGSAWPTFELRYSKAFSLGDNTDVQFDKITASISHSSNLGVFGTTDWRATAGRFLDQTQVYLPDFFMFKGNETVIHDGNFDEFFLLPYYEKATTLPYLEAHAEHAFNGFLLNKVPGLRALKLKEYVGAHFLLRENRRPYLELNAGIELRILKILPIRFDLNFLLLGQPTDARSTYYKLVLPSFGNGVSLGG